MNIEGKMNIDLNPQAPHNKDNILINLTRNEEWSSCGKLARDSQKLAGIDEQIESILFELGRICDVHFKKNLECPVRACRAVTLVSEYQYYIHYKMRNFNDLLTQVYNSLCSQLVPVKPWRQSHVYPVAVTVHVPPFSHGFGEHVLPIPESEKEKKIGYTYNIGIEIIRNRLRSPFSFAQCLIYYFFQSIFILSPKLFTSFGHDLADKNPPKIRLTRKKWLYLKNGRLKNNFVCFAICVGELALI